MNRYAEDTMESLPSVLCWELHGVGWIKPNCPRKLNALTLDVVKILLEKIQEWKDDDRIALVCLYGEGDKGFCAGGDIRSLFNYRA